MLYMVICWQAVHPSAEAAAMMVARHP